MDERQGTNKLAASAKSGGNLKINFPPAAPFEIQFESSKLAAKFRANQRTSKIRQGLLLYLNTLQQLTTQHAPQELRAALPVHFNVPCRALAAIVADGIAIRFERALSNEVVVFGAGVKLADIVPRMTHGFVALAASIEDASKHPVVPFPTIALGTANEDGSNATQILQPRPMGVLVKKLRKSRSHYRMPKLELIVNEFEVRIDGVQLHNPNDPQSHGRPFITRGRVRAPGYWDAVSIYQWADHDCWRTANYADWAERHFFEFGFRRASTEYTWLFRASQSSLRKRYSEILRGLDVLLNAPSTREEDLQTYLSKNPELLAPGFKRVLPKLALGAHVTDFVVEDATGQYLLVELEHPAQELFVRSGHQSSKLTHAVGQVKDWMRYIQDNKSTVERELGLNGISATPNALIVIGRSKSLTLAQRRKLLVDKGAIEVITYDDLRSRFHRTLENFVGMLAHAENQDFIV